jgi:hypothetical protein
MSQGIWRAAYADLVRAAIRRIQATRLCGLSRIPVSRRELDGDFLPSAAHSGSDGVVAQIF